MYAILCFSATFVSVLSFFLKKPHLIIICLNIKAMFKLYCEPVTLIY